MAQNWRESVNAAKGEINPGPNSEIPDYRRIFRDLIVPHRVRTWRGFQKWADGFRGTWAFRGHSDDAWDLETSLDREALLKYEFHSPDGIHHSGMEHLAASYYKPLLREFQSRAHQYLSHPPCDEEPVDWFALMQHYGAPTPMLDWTRSPYVALFFAVEKQLAQRSSSIWAINTKWIFQQAAKSLGEDSNHLPESTLSARATSRVNELWRSVNDSYDAPVVVLPVAPKHVNERMAAQQGYFLCNPSFHARFYVALLSMIIRDEEIAAACVKKLTVGGQQRILFMKELRKMNITAASLFPGLEGFSRSLRHDLEIKMFEEKLARESTNTLS